MLIAHSEVKNCPLGSWELKGLLDPRASYFQGPFSGMDIGCLPLGEGQFSNINVLHLAR